MIKGARGTRYCRRRGVPSMLKHETALNIFLGAIVILRWTAPYLALGVILYGIGIAIGHLLPAVSQDNAYGLMLAFLFAVNCYTSVRSRQWLNALISLAGIVLPLASWWRGVSFFDSPGSITATALMLFLAVSPRRSRHLWEWILLFALVISGVALSAGLIASGAVSRLLTEGSILAAAARFVVLRRRGELTATAGSPSA
jgi:hypothetical protein